MTLGSKADEADVGGGSLGLVTKDIDEVGPINAIEGDWERIKVNVDSGAIDWVTNANTAKASGIKHTKASKTGVGYRAANGTKIENYGEKMLQGYTDDWTPVKVAMQVTDVNKTLGSVYRMNQCGNAVMLDGNDSYVLDKKSGKKTQIILDNGQFVFYLWVRKQKDDGIHDAKGEPSKNAWKKGNRFAGLSEDDENDDMELGFIRQERR